MPRLNNDQFLFDEKPLLDFCDSKQIIALYHILSAKDFPRNIQLRQNDNNLTPLSECDPSQIDACKIALLKKGTTENLPPLFIAYITNVFKLYDVERAIAAKTDLSSSLDRRYERVVNKVTVKSRELELLKNNNEAGIEELERKLTELKAEDKKYQFAKNALMLFSILSFALVAVVASLPAALILAALGTIGLVGEIIFENKSHKKGNKIVDAFSESYKLKQPIVVLEQELNLEDKVLSRLCKDKSKLQEKLQTLTIEQLALKEMVSDFNPEQLDSLKNSTTALHRDGIFKVDNNTTKLTPSIESDMRMVV